MRTNLLDSSSAFATAILLGGLGVAASSNAQEFTYNGDTGPGYWAELSDAWEACAGTGTDARQSPIDIRSSRFDRKLGRLRLETNPTTIDLINNGHTIEQHYEDSGSSIIFEGREYELSQFHFHTLSEHSILNIHADMEMHAVFAEAATDDKLVVGTLFATGHRRNPFLQLLIDAGLPEKDGDDTQSSALVDLSDGLTETSSYFTYEGSLTTPPCTENVTWILLKTPATMSTGQFDAFRSILGNDFRPTQDLNGRIVRATVPKLGSSK
jgi:carbonic anhydrase